MVGSAGIEPATNRLCLPLRLLPPLSSLWSGLSLHPFDNNKFGCLPASLYTPMFIGARDCHSLKALGFPEFDKNHLSITR